MSNVTLKRDNAVSSHSQIIEAFKNRDKEKAIETMRCIYPFSVIRKRNNK